MNMLANLLGMGQDKAPAPVTTTTAQEPSQPASTQQQTSVPETKPTVSPENLAAPIPANTLGSQVVKFLAPAANKALQAAHVEGQDLSGASSIANFVSKPILDQLKGEGKIWEGSKQQAYVRAVVNKLSAVAKEVKNDSSVAQDAVKSIAYIAGSLESSQAVQTAFDTLLGIAEPSAHELANHDEAQARETELKPIAESLIGDIIQAKPVEAIRSVLQKAKIPIFQQQSQARLENTVTQAIKSPNNKNGEVETEISAALVGINSNEHGNDRLASLKLDLKNVESIQKAVTQAGSTDQRLNGQVTKTLQSLTTKITERQSAA